MKRLRCSVWLWLLTAQVWSAAGRAPLTDDQLRATYGSDYVTYRQARMAEDDGQYALAVETYAKVTTGMLGDACRFHRLQCLARLGKLDEAQRGAERFIQEKPDRLYVFDAYLLLARLQYLDGDTPRDAIAAARGTIGQGLKAWDELHPAWEESWRRQRNLPALLLLLRDDDPLEKAKEDFAVTTPMVPPGDRQWPGPERIVNRDTCGWHMSWMRCRLNLFGAFLALEAGDSDAARKHHAAAIAALPLHNGPMQAYVRRVGTGLTQGGWLFGAEIRRNFRLHQRALHLAAYLTSTGHADDALPLFQAVANAAAANDTERAAAILGQLTNLNQQHHWQPAHDLLTQHRKLLQRESLLPQAQVLSQYAW